MMSKKFLPVILVLTAASFFVAFQSQGKNDNADNPRSRYAKILRNVGILLEEGHYSPKKIDDNFSKDVFKKFIEDLDGDKNVLLQSDVDGFKKYETMIDDEVHGAPIESFYAVNTVYLKRQAEMPAIYKEILGKPFDFSVNESIDMDSKNRSFPKTESERKELLRKQMKYMVLERYVFAQDDREKNKGKKDFVVKADSTLEREAREQVSKQMDRYMATRKNRETNDENFSTFVNAITTTMDPHTTYFPPIDLRTFNESMRGSFFGIGAQLKDEDGKIKIASLVTGGPAWKGGELKENDEIIKVAEGNAAPVDVTGYSVTDAIKLIRGAKKGSEVRLTVKKVDGLTKVITLLRDDIKLDEVFAKSAVINGDKKIGYIYLPEFYADFDNKGGSSCAQDVAKELEKLKAENVEGVVLDLRGNGGGSLWDVVQMVGLFIENGPVVQVKGRGDKARVLDDPDKGAVLYNGPLTVLVDETSASASEIFAAAIQDYKRGIVIGSTSTYGKGTVQRNIPLNPQSENSLFNANKEAAEDLGTVKLTLQKFYRINGGATQLRGVEPDVVLPDRLEYLKFREKDNTNALVWDEIKDASYKKWNSTYSTDAVISSSIQDVNNSSTFGKIKTNVEWLGKNYDRAYSLNLDQFKKEQKALKDVFKQIEEAYKLPKAMDLKSLAADAETINSSKEKTDRNKQWIKMRSEDIYIDESVKILTKMIEQANLAKVGG
ncbi:MAG: PDZ domain-containing protein [Sphingobacteriales bacterium]|nr:MAG: PDZ domain-containing protein [Sphingobacteriales bacterium]